MNRALIPDLEARERLRRQCEADLPIVTPVWVATEGGAAMETIPKFRNHGEEVAWWKSQRRQK